MAAKEQKEMYLEGRTKSGRWEWVVPGRIAPTTARQGWRSRSWGKTGIPDGQ